MAALPGIGEHNIQAIVCRITTVLRLTQSLVFMAALFGSQPASARVTFGPRAPEREPAIAEPAGRVGVPSRRKVRGDLLEMIRIVRVDD